MTIDTQKSTGVTLSLAGKTALITGGSRGIGAATVRLFAQAGARVAFSYQSATAQANALAAETGAAPIQQDLATTTDGRTLIASAIKSLGRIDCLIVNHGIWPAHDAPIATMSDAQWRATIGINLDSVFGLTQAFVAQLAPENAAAAHIVFISSTAGQRGEAFHADYAASKGAIISLTKSLSSELAPRNIHVNCVAPGWVATEMSAAAFADPITSNKITAAIPLGRPATPLEIAGPVLFLCTPLAGFISGEIFNVNGGAVLVG